MRCSGVGRVEEGTGTQLTMRGVRAKVRPRMSVGMLFTNDLQTQHDISQGTNTKVVSARETSVSTRGGCYLSPCMFSNSLRETVEMAVDGVTVQSDKQAGIVGVQVEFPRSAPLRTKARQCILPQGLLACSMYNLEA